MTTERTAVTRWGRAGALYDLVASIAFVTPWTSGVVLDVLGVEAAIPTRLFATLFGTVVMMWSIARWLRPEPVLIGLDTAGRAMFSLWFVWALANGETRVLWGFLVLELFWGAAQLRALVRR
ncbi:hypothetical protein SAMN05216553_106437 [Lentzea fradiae]|uniref:Uncharacterized protein n=1 Tax=Lentzea fradiae TaxID=200378 RepID=A0A1G7SUE7_9PSEU|nr:hypothetical protein [Lentzea fradiae]SDG25900.1 hypothetical protein SAMN05216553_106437 [Lentzea fradiae]